MRALNHLVHFGEQPPDRVTSRADGQARGIPWPDREPLPRGCAGCGRPCAGLALTCNIDRVIYNGCEHLKPVLETLLAAGNSVVPHPMATGPFRPSQGRMYCPLTKPIDFGAIADAPRGPEVTFHPDDDSIFCRPCWLPIYGGENLRRSHEAWARATGRR